MNKFCYFILGVFSVFVVVTIIYEIQGRGIKEGVVVSKFDAERDWCSIVVRGADGAEKTFRMRQIEFNKFELGQKVETKNLSNFNR